MNHIYVKIKKSKNTYPINTIEIPKIITFKNKGIILSTYFNYSVRKYNKIDTFDFSEAYNINITKSKSFKLVNTSKQQIYLNDNLFNKIILIKHFFTPSNYLYYKNTLIPKYVISQVFHRQTTLTNNLSFLNSNNTTLNNLNFYNLYTEYTKLYSQYIYWKYLFNNKYNFNLVKGFYLKHDSTNNSTTPTKDITSGLISIETIFESRAVPNKYLIPVKLSILNSLFLSYESTTSNYLWNYNLYTFNTKKLLYYTEINSVPFINLENKTSILLPNNIITSGNYSINSLLIKIFSNNLNYYLQDQAITISHIFVFNIIVESLLKQYFKNGIIIPSIQFELIAKKMTSFVKINYTGDSSMQENDIFEFGKLKTLNYTLSNLGYTPMLYRPIVLGITKSVLASSGFLSSISFQEIIKSLLKLSIENATDWLTDLKSKIITTDLIKTGSGWYRHFIKI